MTTIRRQTTMAIGQRIKYFRNRIGMTQKQLGEKLGFKGSLFSGLGVILPSFVVILLIAMIFVQFKDNPVVERIFKGIRPAVVALIAAPLLMLGKSAKITWKNGWIPVSVALLVWLLGVSPIYIVLGAIVLGILHLVYVKKRLKR